jgi:hypothetical protein
MVLGRKFPLFRAFLVTDKPEVISPTTEHPKLIPKSI